MIDLVSTPLRRLTLVALVIAGMALPGIAAAQQIEKGVMTNGENHFSPLVANEMHKWTLAANAGEAIVVTVAKVGDTSTFTPRLEVFRNDNGLLLGASNGTLAAHVTVSAPATITYAVFVTSGNATGNNSGAGDYVVTVAKVPGAFVVPVGDDGGAMTNGGNHPGYITRGDQDIWNFTAAAGESFSVSVGQVGMGPDTLFAPWIRLFSPTGALIGEGYSQLGGKVDFTTTTAGTYTVVVASGDAIYAETGYYKLALAKRGPFTVPTGDEGGPMTSGVLYQAAITRADLDQWTFQATAGQQVQITATEVGTSGFFPWLRLYAPNGAAIGDSFGASSAQITLNAPATGQYSVVVASADGTYTAAGNYSLRATGIGAPPAVDLGDIAVNFGTNYGLYVHANHAGGSPQWTQIHPTSPTRIARGDIDGTGLVSVIATFQGQGTWIWRAATGWSLLHPLDASQIIAADLDGNGQEDIIVDFPGQGLWVRYNNISWAQLHPADVTAVAAGDIDGDIDHKADLIVNFAGYGVWAFVNASGWVQLHALDAFDIQTGDFDNNGQDDVVMNFTGQGIWIRYNNGSWAQLHPVNSAGITVGDIDGNDTYRKDIVINFTGYGVWAFLNNGTWAQIHPLNAPVLATVDLEKNGKDDVILNFPGQGIWLYKNNATFEQLHPADVRGVVGARFDIN